MLLDQRKIQSRKWIGACIGTVAVIATVSLAYGAERSGRDVSAESPNPGKVVVDPAIQKIAERILNEAIKEQKAGEGFAIVADPMSGRILAVANVDSKKKKTGYWALSQQLEPASVFKSLVVAEAIEQGKTSPQERHFCENGSYEFGGRVFHDWRDTGFDQLTTTQTVARSSNICAIKIAERIGAEGVLKMLPKFGFGPEGSARDFPAGMPGQLPSEDEAKKKLLVAYAAYGQGFLATPLEVLQAYGSIANGGNLLAPLPANAKPSEARIVRRVLSAETAEKMRSVLREVVLTGTGKKNAGSDLYTTAGKTASSYSPDLNQLDWMGGHKKSNLAGFIGFAPVNEPRVEIYVGIKDPNTDHTGAHGAEHAAPVFKKIAEAVLQEMKVAPDKNM